VLVESIADGRESRPPPSPTELRLWLALMGLKAPAHADLSETTGIARWTITNILNGRQKATPDVLRALKAAILGFAGGDLEGYFDRIEEAAPPLSESQVAAIRAIVRSVGLS
jgi:hypothetical protein